MKLRLNTSLDAFSVEPNEIIVHPHKVEEVKVFYHPSNTSESKAVALLELIETGESSIAPTSYHLKLIGQKRLQPSLLFDHRLVAWVPGGFKTGWLVLTLIGVNIGDKVTKSVKVRNNINEDVIVVLRISPEDHGFQLQSPNVTLAASTSIEYLLLFICSI
jgi:hypothetical protein